MTSILHAHNITKTYQVNDINISVLKNISFEIYEGEIIVILGVSGTGKSTLLNILGGLIPPDSGDVFVNEKSLYTISDEQRTNIRSSQIGFIFQDFNLISELTILENIRLPYDIVSKTYDTVYENTLFKLLDIEKRLHFYPDMISGGEKQRVAIARALLLHPSIILADEPTGNLDVKSSNTIIDFVHKSNRDFKQTFIIVTHDYSWLNVANRVFTISSGGLIIKESVI